MSEFAHLEKLPEDPILGLQSDYLKDPNLQKVNLGIGVYQNENGKTEILECIKEAERRIFEKQMDKDYLPIEGHPELCQLAPNLIFSRDFNDTAFSCTVQTIGATGALRIGGELIAKLLTKHIYVPKPSWQNHTLIFSSAGLNVQEYPYYDVKSQTLSLDAILTAIEQMPRNSVILFHASCHNPSGEDPTVEQWRQLSQKIKKQGVIPFFDCAYQGLGVSFEEDIQPLKIFAEDGHLLFIAYSFSKNLGLYGERAGFLEIINNDSRASANALMSHLKRIIRASHSVPPLHSSRLVVEVLKDPHLFSIWQHEITLMRSRIQNARALFAHELTHALPECDFSYLTRQKGLFSFCDLSSSDILEIRKQKGIYMPSNARVNLAGLNKNNIDYVVQSLVEYYRK